MNEIVGALFPGELSLIDAMVYAVIEKTSDEIVASLSLAEKMPDAPGNRVVSRGVAPNDITVAKVSPQYVPENVQAVSVSSFSRKPLLWISACISVLTFGASGTVYSLHADRKRRKLS